eukprot:9947487-Karenia_brevis.AAC.1
MAASRLGDAGAPGSPTTTTSQRQPHSTPKRQWRPRVASPSGTVSHELSLLRISTPPPTMEIDSGIPLADMRRSIDIHAE